jgi:hypothetical protein
VEVVFLVLAMVLVVAQEEVVLPQVLAAQEHQDKEMMAVMVMVKMLQIEQEQVAVVQVRQVKILKRLMMQEMAVQALNG